MNININELEHEADIWLTSSERNSEMVNKMLESIFSGFKQNNYTVTVLISGKKECKDAAMALILNQLSQNVSV